MNDLAPGASLAAAAAGSGKPRPLRTWPALILVAIMILGYLQ